ncbi:cytochrome P450 [Hysterangium stoloniferum]|nr:cytochrome P450 [Hysterangium stoloniferum]
MFSPVVAGRYQPLQQKHTRALLKCLYNIPRASSIYYDTILAQSLSKSELSLFRIYILSHHHPAPLEALKNAMKTQNAGRDYPCIVVTLLEDLAARPEAPPDQEDIILNVASCTSLLVFVLAMLLFPDSQQKAEKELDAVVGPRHPPNFEDKEVCPTWTALWKEVLRWYTVILTGPRHRLSQDDIIDKYFVPAVAMVLGNAW